MVEEVEIERWSREDKRNMEQVLEKFSDNVSTKIHNNNQKNRRQNFKNNRSKAL
jgi:ABC-type xylose transport system substrate-binding protein